MNVIWKSLLDMMCQNYGLQIEDKFCPLRHGTYLLRGKWFWYTYYIYINFGEDSVLLSYYKITSGFHTHCELCFSDVDLIPKLLLAVRQIRCKALRITIVEMSSMAIFAMVILCMLLSLSMLLWYSVHLINTATTMA